MNCTGKCYGDEYMINAIVIHSKNSYYFLVWILNTKMQYKSYFFPKHFATCLSITFSLLDAKLSHLSQTIFFLYFPVGDNFGTFPPTRNNGQVPCLMFGMFSLLPLKAWIFGGWFSNSSENNFFFYFSDTILSSTIR